MVVVQLVDREPTVTNPPDKPEMTQESQLMRDERLLEPDSNRQCTNRARPVAQTREQPHAARCRERMHRLGNRLGHRAIDVGEGHSAHVAMAHDGLPQ